MTFPTWYLLGLCTWGFVPGNHELSFRLCEAEYAAKIRHIVPHRTKPDIPDFKVLVSQVVWPKPESTDTD